jgi:hypothetical protein
MRRFTAAIAALTYVAATSQTNRRLLGNRYVYRCHLTLDEEILLYPSKVTPLLRAISHVSLPPAPRPYTTTRTSFKKPFLRYQTPQ